MAVGLSGLPVMHPVIGLALGTTRAGIKKPDRRDLVVFELAPGSTTAAVFTRNAFCAAPVVVARNHLQTASPRFLVINTGYANAGTGTRGIDDALRCCEQVAVLGGCRTEEVLPFSTGVIGEPLPVGRITAGLPDAFANLLAEGWEEAAHGIMTTDTVAKGASQVVEIGGQVVTVTGIAKGAGMIRPDMATMLAFIGTDAAVEPSFLQRALVDAVNASFNRITVDGDTSTNDACVLVATGQAAGPRLDGKGEVSERFADAVKRVCQTLAQAIVRDGEGATKFITVHIDQAADKAEALQVAYTIAHSPLVKTAFFAGDPNWGRILAAVGRAGLADLALDEIEIYLDDVCIVRDGGRAPDYTEAQGQDVMQQDEITVRVVLGRGAVTEQVWTTDFSYDYVRINAEYRT